MAHSTSTSTTKLIGITGVARSGKDTVADFLAKLLPSFGRYSFATPMKDMILVGLSIRDKDDDASKRVFGHSYRHLAQTLGTEWGRDLIRSNIWVIIAESRLRGDKVIISDVRFENEAAYVREHGVLIHVSRLCQEQIKESGHVSENGVKFKEGDIRIYNDGGLVELEDKCEYVAKRDFAEEIGKEEVGSRGEVARKLEAAHWGLDCLSSKTQKSADTYDDDDAHFLSK